MKGFTLRFKSNECENEYQSEYRMFFRNSILIAGLLVGVLILIQLTQALISSNRSLTIIQSLFLFFLIILLAAFNFFPLTRNHLMAVISIFFAIFCTELTVEMMEDKVYGFLVANICSNLISTTLKACDWITKSTSLFLSSVYISIRLPMKSNYELYPIYFLSFGLLAHCAFLLEKHNRNLYLSMRKKLNNERMWAYLIEEVYNESTILLGMKRNLRGTLSKTFLNTAKKLIRHPSSSPMSNPDPKASLIFGRFKTLEISKKTQLDYGISEPAEIVKFLRRLTFHNDEDEIIEPNMTNGGGSNNLGSGKGSHFKGFSKRNSESIGLSAKHSNMEDWLNYFLRTETLARKSTGVSGNAGPVMERLKCIMISENKKDKMKKKRIDVLVILFHWNNKPRVLIKFSKMNMKEKLKNLKRIDRYKDRFLASITHDLKTPLFGVESMIDFAMQEESALEREQQLKIAKINTQLLANLINDILDYSQIRESKFRRDLNYFLLQDILEEVLSLMRIQADFRNLSLKLFNNLPKDLKLFSDSRRLKQVMINLISNSLKFTTAGFVHIFINEISPNLIKIEVIDSGAGIEKSNIESLAQPYNTLDNPKGMNRDGIGLGLFNCKNIVSMLGPFPRIFISSKVGHGSKFGFVIFKICDDQSNLQSEIKGINNVFNNTTAAASTSHRNYFKVTNSTDSHLNFSKTINIDESRNVVGFQSSTVVNLEAKIPNFHLLVSGENSPMVMEQNNNFLSSSTRPPRRYGTLSKQTIIQSNKYYNSPLGYDPLSIVSSKSDQDSSQRVIPENLKENGNSDCQGDQGEDLFEKNFELNFSSFASEIEEEDNADYQYEKKVMKRNDKHSISPVSPNKLRQRAKWSFGEALGGGGGGFGGSFGGVGNQLSFLNELKLSEMGRQDSQESLEKKEAHILIVDDNPFNLIILEKFLSKIDSYTVKIDKALNGQIAVDLFMKRNAPGSANRYSIIFMDCQMPIMDGFMASHNIRSKILTERYLNCVILGFTSIVGSEEINQGKLCGMEEILQKPAKESFITEVCCKYLSRLLE